MGSVSPAPLAVAAAALLLLASLVLPAIAIPARSDEEVRDLYEGWLLRHQRGWVYNALGEKERRFEIFKDNLRFIDEHNAAADAMERSSHLGLTRFADLTNDEFRSTYLGVLAAGHQWSGEGSDRYLYRAGDELPEKVDWREKGAVVTSYNEGCNGGLMDYAFEFIITNGGIDTEKDYPYKERDDRCDQLRKNARVVTIDLYEDVPANDEKSLQKAVVNQPFSVSIEGGGRAFQLYESEECSHLRQSIKCGLINRLTVRQVQEKAMALQAVRVNDHFFAGYWKDNGGCFFGRDNARS